MYFDLYSKLRTEGQFRHRMAALAADLKKVEALVEAGKAPQSRAAEILMAIYRLSDYNPSLLVPYFFPKYPRNSPLSLLPRPFMIEMMKLQVGGSTTIRASRQIGKCVDGRTAVAACAAGGEPEAMEASALFDACKAAATPAAP
jgi:hypothetical protein